MRVHIVVVSGLYLALQLHAFATYNENNHLLPLFFGNFVGTECFE